MQSLCVFVIRSCSFIYDIKYKQTMQNIIEMSRNTLSWILTFAPATMSAASDSVWPFEAAARAGVAPLYKRSKIPTVIT